MRVLFLIAFGVAWVTLLSAQSVSSSFLSTFDAERGQVVIAAHDGNLWLGGMKDEQTLLAKVRPDGKVLQTHLLNLVGNGLDTENLMDLFEDSDGTLVGCGNFENDNLSRGFVFRYDPATQQTLWAHTVSSGSLNYLYGITPLGAGGDYVLYGNPHFATGDDAELVRIRRSTGQAVAGSAKRLHLGSSDQVSQLIYHEGALYGCGRFTAGNFGIGSYGKMRHTLCRIDTATLEPVWTRLSPQPTAAEARLYGRDLVLDAGHLISTFSGDATGPDLETATVFLQKNDLSGESLWAKEYKLWGWQRPFAEEVIPVPDGYLLYGYELQSDTSRLFLLKTDKSGELLSLVQVESPQPDVNTTLTELPSRSKAVRIGEAIFLTATGQDALGQTRGLLLKTDLDGWVNDSCAAVRRIPGEVLSLIQNANETVVPTVQAGQATTLSTNVLLNDPPLTLTKACGAAGTCPTLPDLQLTLDSIVCNDGHPLLYYTICNVGGQPYDGSIFLFLYDRNPLTDTAKFTLPFIGSTQEPLPPGECYSGIPISSDVFGNMPFELDTFKELYGLLGVNFSVQTPVPLSGFPYPPGSPECGYLNNLSSIDVPDHLCGTCDDPLTYVKVLGNPDQAEQAYSMCLSRDNSLYLLGKQDASLLLTKLGTLGDPIWARQIPVAPNIYVEPAEILEDSEGNLVFCGTVGGSPSNRQALVMRYDPVAAQVLWVKIYPENRPSAANILEKAPGGNYLLQCNYQAFIGGVLQTRVQMLEISRITGEVVPASAVQYLGEPHLRFERIAQFPDGLYAAGTRNTAGQPNSAYPVFAKLSPTTLQPLWSLDIDPDTTTTLRKAVGFVDMAYSDGFILLAGPGQIGPDDPGNTPFVYIERYKPDGTRLWSRHYDIPLQVEEVVAYPNACFVYGRVAGTNELGWLKVDNFGNVLQASVLTTAPKPSFIVGYNSRQGLMLPYSLQLLTADHIFYDNGQSDLLLARTDLNFALDDACDRLKPIQVATQTMPSKVQPFDIPLTALPVVAANFPLSLVPTHLDTRQLCPDCGCDSLPDFRPEWKQVACSADSLGVVMELDICNTTSLAQTLPFWVTVFHGDPLTQSAQPVWSAQIDSLGADTCISLRAVLSHSALVGADRLYAVVGADSTVVTPFGVTDFPFSSSAAECDYTNNFDSIAFALPPAPVLELGQDTTICAGATVTLTAGAGFHRYTWWPGGSVGPALVVSQSGHYAVQVTDSCGRVQSDSIRVTMLPPLQSQKTINFYPGDTIVIDGQTYTQPDTVERVLNTAIGCDSVVTTILQWVITEISLQCPANLTVTLPPNQPGTVVDYALPTATTSCPDSTIILTLIAGLAVGDTFPEGATLVCYEAYNACGIRDTCCFTITAQQPDLPCDVKAPPGCVRFELLNVAADSIGQRRYRVRMTNTCASPLQFAYIQLPPGIKAVTPAEGSAYLAPSGNTYTVRNPNASPFYSLRFKPLAGDLSSGESEVFAYVLPEQVQPAYIHVAARLADGSYAQAHLNTYNCPVLPYTGMRPAGRSQSWQGLAGGSAAYVWPNPTTGVLMVEWPGIMQQSVQGRVVSPQGQVLLQQTWSSQDVATALLLPESLPSGLYYLILQATTTGERATVRFVVEH